MKLIPEKDSTAAEAQTRAPLGDPERAGLPAGKDSVQHGRVTQLPLPPHPLLLLPSGAQGPPPDTAQGAGSHLY